MSFSFSFRPSLIYAMRGYNRARFMRDVGAGLTVAVVALPLAMAFAIASGLKPEAGLFTAIIGGFIISALGGSRVQIGGPAGAFIVIVYGIVQQYGVGNLMIATILSGILLLLMGVFKIGSLIRFIPNSVIIGFTNGIAVLIGLSQIKDFFGFQVQDLPADFFGMLTTLWTYRSTIDAWTSGLSLASLGLLAIWQFGLPALHRRLPTQTWLGRLNQVPGPIVLLVIATTVVSLLHLPVETIGSRFGGIPSSLPTLSLPQVDWSTSHLMLMPAFTLALLGAIESLLCARVADGMIGERHDPNQELMAQGVANIAAPLFAGMPATGTIARTVTNVKAGASSPMAGIIHAAILLLVVLVAAPLASSIPLAALAAILMFVAFNMGQWSEFVRLRRYRLPYRFVLLSVFLLTVVFDLTVAVQFGILAACVTFIYRISSLSGAEPIEHPSLQALEGVQAWRLQGSLFFGATGITEKLEDQLPEHCLILDFNDVIYMDTTGGEALYSLIEEAQNAGTRVLVPNLHGQCLDMARRVGLLQLLRLHGRAEKIDLAQAFHTARQLTEARNTSGDKKFVPDLPV